MSAPSKPADNFRVLVELVMRRLAISEDDAEALLVALGDALAREVLLRKKPVRWPRLGLFQSYEQAPRDVDLTALKSLGHVPPTTPDRIRLPSQLKMRFRPSRWSALRRGTT
jgi:nucleoid DNA-binding protein